MNEYLPPTPPGPNPESLETKDGKNKDKTTDSKGIGKFAMRRTPKEEKGTEESRESLFLKPEKPNIETKDEAPAAETDAQPKNPEHLTEEEVALTWQQLAEAHEQQAAAAPTPENPVEQTAEADVSDLRQRIIDGQDPEVALSEKLSESDIHEATPSESPQPEQEETIEPEPPVNEDFPLDKSLEIPRDTAVGNEPQMTSTDGGARPPRRSPNPLIPRATPFGSSGSGLYTKNIAAAGGRPGATFKPEYVPVKDETLLGILPGAIVGYIIGRRRGKAKAESQASKVRKSLEKKVESLEQDLSFKENQVRQASREKARRQAVAAVETPAKEKAPSVERRAPAPEAHQLHGKKSAPESIGKVLVQAESVPVLEAAEAAVMSIEKPQKQPAAKSSEKQIETISHAELLELSEKIDVNGSTLKQIYETRLVSEKGLRRLVAEHLSGGDVKKGLRREIVEREIDFERDPIMRDSAHQQTAPSGGGSTKLQEFLEKADAVPHDNQEEVAFIKARAEYEERERAKQQSRRRVLDVSMITSIVVLAILLTILLLQH